MRNTYGVTVTVNGKPWRRVPNFTDAGARDRVFTVVRTDGGKTVVQFGDGVHGARPPVGSKMAFGYRTGAGSGTVAERHFAPNWGSRAVDAIAELHNSLSAVCSNHGEHAVARAGVGEVGNTPPG